MMQAGETSVNEPGWNQLIGHLPGAHMLQSSQWAAVKSRFGWIPHYLVWERDTNSWKMRILDNPEAADFTPAAAGLLLERRAAPGLIVLYMPKGPLLEDESDPRLQEQVFADLERFARKRGALQIKIDPDLELGRGIPGQEDATESDEGADFQRLLSKRGWHFSKEQIQFRNTVLVDLREDEDQILARMKSKTRYNIRLSGRKGIQVRRGNKDDLPGLYKMYAETSLRGGFTIRGEEYYRYLWGEFMGEECGRKGNPAAQPLIAEFEGQPVAGAVIFSFGKRAWYLHGMSLPDHSEKMAPHLIQWEAMRWAKEQGCEVYDMWGAPEIFNESDSLWGVYRFKRGFGGEVSRTAGAWDFPARPFYYRIYSQWLPRLLNIPRWFRDRRTSWISRLEA